MTIKKPMKAPTVAPETPAAPAAAGGATIADRFKLDVPEAKPKAAAGKGATFATLAGFAALAVVGILAYVLWQHWAYLMPA